MLNHSLFFLCLLHKLTVVDVGRGRLVVVVPLVVVGIDAGRAVVVILVVDGRRDVAGLRFVVGLRVVVRLRVVVGLSVEVLVGLLDVFGRLVVVDGDVGRLLIVVPESPAGVILTPSENSASLPP